MKNLLNENIKNLAYKLPKPLYVVGGFIRNYIINGKPSKDIDLASSLPIEILKENLTEFGFSVVGEYKRTETLLFSDGVQKYEYTAFRREVYEKGGAHTPIKTFLVEDVELDAKRRDFKCNAVYYDIKKGEIIDVLGGVKDIENKVLDTVIEPEEVFSHDGLRLMRLARFVGELGFTPTEKIMQVAKNNARNILDVSRERIFAELKMILVADKKYSFSQKNGHYLALKVLDETRVLDYIFPDLTLGRNMEQRKDYHKYDVLEHSLRAFLYAPKEMRLFALLHDIGKPYAMNKDGRYRLHAVYGEDLVRKALKNLLADNKTIEKAVFLTKNHMLDKNCETSESKVRAFIVENGENIKDLLAIMQADHTAYKDQLGVCPTVKKWQSIHSKMKKENAPFSLKELNITAQNLIDIGVKGDRIGKTLKKLLIHCAVNPKDNNLERLVCLALDFQGKNGKSV